MLPLLRSLARNRRLLRDFVVRDLRARYVGSSMGFFWSVIFPLVNLVVYYFVFCVLLGMRWGDQMPKEQVLLIMFAGVLIWTAFAESLIRITNSLVDNANLIQKVVFPAEILAPYLTASSITNASFGLPLVVVGVLWFGYLSPSDAAVAEASGPATLELAMLDPGASSPPVLPLGLAGDQGGPAPSGELAEPTQPYLDNPVQEVVERPLRLGPGLVLLPLLLLFQMIFTVGLGYLFSTLHVFWRDATHLVAVFIQVWMFATPIFYPANMVTLKGYGWVLAINPMHWLIQSYRDVLLYGDFPPLWRVGGFALVAALVFFGGAAFFRAQRDRFPDLL